jgi:hypothetical protein
LPTTGCASFGRSGDCFRVKPAVKNSPRTREARACALTTTALARAQPTGRLESPKSKRPRPGRRTTAFALAPARPAISQRHGRERQRGPTLTITSTIHATYAGRSPPTASRLRHLGRGTRQPPGVAHVCFLRVCSSACRGRLDPGGSCLRPDPIVRGLDPARLLLLSRPRGPRCCNATQHSPVQRSAAPSLIGRHLDHAGSRRRTSAPPAVGIARGRDRCHDSPVANAIAGPKSA